MDVLAACRRSICTFSEPQAINYIEVMVSHKTTKYTFPLIKYRSKYFELVFPKAWVKQHSYRQDLQSTQ
ncbi:hypothetical protein EKG38_21765 [Shewanella canadensis]|uniref:Uncharacterized protein n=1 Tax=Shewanella canadensis TaxID=271096 RepID=A0A3S0IJY5_9GAMM|nr:hypothetical protein EKG38_21765 [Shewanella canadensis]